MPNRPETPEAGLARMLQGRGIREPGVLGAIARVPRVRFVPPEQRSHAVEDRALRIAEGQTISQPYMVALMTQELRLTGQERVLEIGTGSGYQTAILAELAREVYTVERIGRLSLQARAVLDGQGYTNIHFREGDGTLGWPDEAPFDCVLVTACAPSLPRRLVEQLAEGGRLVLPMGSDEEQTLYVVRKEKGRIREQPVIGCRFVRLVGAEGWPSVDD